MTGDLLDGSAADRPSVLGIQSCPRCDPVAHLCQGGPRHGMACTQGSSEIGACADGPNAGGQCAVDGDCPESTCDTSVSAHPTSHDCPPPPNTFVGGLPIPFALTTGTQIAVSTDFAPGNDGRDHVFCGFCGTVFTGPSTFEGPPRPCTSDAECTNEAFPRCRQRTVGGFGNGLARTIIETGVPAGDVRDRAEHAATLVSVFCIPPSYTPLVDAAGDLPSPAAVSLPGTAQLLPTP